MRMTEPGPHKRGDLAPWESNIRRVDTVEQLASLPFLSVVREIHRTSPSGADYGGVYERRASGWQAISGVYVESPANGSPTFPLRLLYHPGIDRVSTCPCGLKERPGSCGWCEE